MSYSVTVESGSIGKIASILAMAELWDLDDGNIEILEFLEDGQISFIINLLAQNVKHWGECNGTRLTNFAVKRLQEAIDAEPDRGDK